MPARSPRPRSPPIAPVAPTRCWSAARRPRRRRCRRLSAELAGGRLRRGRGADRPAAGARTGRRCNPQHDGMNPVQGFQIPALPDGAEHALFQRRALDAAAADRRRRRDPDAASRAAAAPRPLPAEPSARGDAEVLRARDPAAAPVQGRSDFARRDAPAPRRAAISRAASSASPSTTAIATITNSPIRS